MMVRTSVVMLTWNKINIFKNTINSFKKYNPDIKDENVIIVDNGSSDGTQDFLRKTNYDVILNKINLGAQMGKYVGWNRALEKGFDFIIFIEDDHPCIRTIPVKDLETYLDRNKDIGIIRLNDKKYLKRHQITHLSIEYYSKENINDGSYVTRCNYHFTSHPSVFRTSLVPLLKGCVFPELKPKNINIEKLGFEKYKGTKKYEIAKERCLMDFGIREKEYMRLFLLRYQICGQLYPACFKWVDSRRMKDWKN